MEKMKKIEITSLITTIICGMIAGTLMYDALSSCVIALIMKSSYSGLIGRMYNAVAGAPICLYSLPLLLIVILMILNLTWIKKEI